MRVVFIMIMTIAACRKPTIGASEGCGAGERNGWPPGENPGRKELKAPASRLKVGDDAADALRYLVATKGREIVVRKLRGL
jgi:hypothetical protein